MSESQLDAWRRERPWPVKLLNKLGHSLAHDGASWVPFDAGDMILEAERSTGLSDWGSEPLAEPLGRLIRSIEDEAELNLMGRLMMQSNLRRQLANRLKLQNDWKQHPEILAEPVRRPLFIVGLPRTGSTLLQRLLSRDPAVRSLQTWEMMLPSPPPQEATRLTDPRIRKIDRQLRILHWSAPEVAIAHEVVAGEPEECVSLLQNSLASPAFELFCNLPGYRAWVDAQDPRIAYRYYRKQLQLLQWKHRKDHWVLKSPFHLLGLEAILELFPDAVIVQTHREPQQVVPSLCSLFTALHGLNSDRADPHQIGPRWLERLARANDMTIDLRERVGSDRFVDVSFRAMLEDPFRIVREINERFDYPFTEDSLTEIRAWHEQNPQHKHGVHRYRPEEFGLDADTIDAQFARYRERFAAYL